jgi:hypothetical protein
MIPELFVTPTPLIKYAAPGTPVIVYALAAALNVMPPNEMNTELLESFTVVCVESPNDATSVNPFGTVLGDQLFAFNQSLEVGDVDHVALPARPVCVRGGNSSTAADAAVKVSRETARRRRRRMQWMLMRIRLSECVV